MTWDNLSVHRGHDEYYDEKELHKAYEAGRKDGWREAMEEAKHSGYGERSYGYGERDNYGERTSMGVKHTPYTRYR